MLPGRRYSARRLLVGCVSTSGWSATSGASTPVRTSDARDSRIPRRHPHLKCLQQRVCGGRNRKPPQTDAAPPLATGWRRTGTCEERLAQWSGAGCAYHCCALTPNGDSSVKLRYPANLAQCISCHLLLVFLVLFTRVTLEVLYLHERSAFRVETQAPQHSVTLQVCIRASIYSRDPIRGGYPHPKRQHKLQSL